MVQQLYRRCYLDFLRIQVRSFRVWKITFSYLSRLLPQNSIILECPDFLDRGHETLHENFCKTRQSEHIRNRQRHQRSKSIECALKAGEVWYELFKTRQLLDSKAVHSRPKWKAHSIKVVHLLILGQPWQKEASRLHQVLDALFDRWRLLQPHITDGTPWPLLVLRPKTPKRND